MSLTVLAIADQVHPSLYEYFELERWKDIDLVLSAGDLPTEYLDFLCTALNVPIFYVRGNHDGDYPAGRYAGSENVHGRIVEYQGIRIAGFEGSRRYKEGSCQYTERAMSRVVRVSQVKALRLGRPDIVLTHAPPAGCHDGHDVCHRGFQCFQRIIDSWQPRFLVHGHTHRHYGQEMVSTVGNTTVINAFPLYRFELPEVVPLSSHSEAMRRTELRGARTTLPPGQSGRPA